MAEWQKFKVGEPSSDSNGSSRYCMPFSEVYHVSHINTSLGVLTSELLVADLVFDESRLNQQRIRVVWLSPNTWGKGYRYGNIRFRFSFISMIRDRYYYWVESIAYKIPACRILITETEYSSLTKYDPTQGDGPWWHDSSSNTHYFNNKYCMEFMFERDISLHNVLEIDFVDHHRKWCARHRTFPHHCPDLGKCRSNAAAEFLALILGRDIAPPHLLFGKASGHNGLPNRLSYALSWLCLEMIPRSFAAYTGNIDQNHSASPALSRALCNAYSLNLNAEVAHLLGLFASENDCLASLTAFLRQQFKLPANGS